MLAIDKQGERQALRAVPRIANGLNVRDGRIIHAGVAQAMGLDYVAPGEVVRV